MYEMLKYVHVYHLSKGILRDPSGNHPQPVMGVSWVSEEAWGRAKEGRGLPKGDMVGRATAATVPPPDTLEWLGISVP